MVIDWNALSEYFERNEIKKLLVFGSEARGEAQSSSDIDLIISFNGKKSLLDIIRIERELSELLDRKVDLLTEGAISPHMIKQIMSEAKVVFERAA